MLTWKNLSLKVTTVFSVLTIQCQHKTLEMLLRITRCSDFLFQ